MQPKILLLEDLPADAELVQVELMLGGIDAEILRVASRESFVAALSSFEPDIILSDFNLPGFSGMSGLDIRNQQAQHIPFIFVTGSLGEEMAVSTLRSGATDFVLKDRMARLPAAVSSALDAHSQRKERERVDRELTTERSLMQAVLDAAQAMIVVLDDGGHIMHANAAAERMASQSRQNMIGCKFWEIMSQSDQSETVRQHLQTALDPHSDVQQPSWPMITRTEQRTVVCSSAKLSSNYRGERLVVCGIDVTEQERAEKHAFFLGHFDPVTSLPNRRHFLQQLSEYCSRRDTDTGTALVIMMVGMARVQEIADSYGDAAFNQVLIEIVQRLRVWQSHADLLARVADSSFALAFEVGRGPDLDMLVPHILEQLREPIKVGQAQILPVVYGGLALYPDNASEAGLLLQAAESALHCVTPDSVQNFAFYTPLLSDQIRERLLLESELREALKTDDQLILHYQPQVDIATGHVIGLEALIRWRHPRLDWLPPGRFIPLAEVCGLMVPLGRWVMRRTCRQLQEWKTQGFVAPTVAVNLSAGQFSAPSLIEDVDATMREFGVEPHQLELELTESASMSHPDASIIIMQQLRDMGLKIAIDDFGTGYSNLSYLKRFPVDRLKLDQAFVRDIMTDPDDLAISRAIIAMAHQLRLEVVAEGVETKEQLKLLASAGCRTVQGYLFSRPVAPETCQGLVQLPFTIY
ncbi:MAG: diguanylate cyclase [Rhodocyclales bacterium]|nr:diguanylate cyclase [Rhodocyclales bacterium]